MHKIHVYQVGNASGCFGCHVIARACALSSWTNSDTYGVCRPLGLVLHFTPPCHLCTVAIEDTSATYVCINILHCLSRHFVACHYSCCTTNYRVPASSQMMRVAWQQYQHQQRQQLACLPGSHCSIFSSSERSTREWCPPTSAVLTALKLPAAAG